MFAKEIKQLADNLAALREFVEVVNPMLEIRHREVGEETAPSLLPFSLVLNALQPERMPLEEELKETIRKDLPRDCRTASGSFRSPTLPRSEGVPALPWLARYYRENGLRLLHERPARTFLGFPVFIYHTIGKVTD